MTIVEHVFYSHYWFLSSNMQILTCDISAFPTLPACADKLIPSVSVFKWGLSDEETLLFPAFSHGWHRINTFSQNFIHRECGAAAVRPGAVEVLQMKDGTFTQHVVLRSWRMTAIPSVCVWGFHEVDGKEAAIDETPRQFCRRDTFVGVCSRACLKMH